jgi:hypothetical protein
MKLRIKTKTTDIGHFRLKPDCHTAWSRILSVVIKLYTFIIRSQESFVSLARLSHD